MSRILGLGLQARESWRGRGPQRKDLEGGSERGSARLKIYLQPGKLDTASWAIINSRPSNLSNCCNGPTVIQIGLNHGQSKVNRETLSFITSNLLEASVLGPTDRGCNLYQA